MGEQALKTLGPRYEQALRLYEDAGMAYQEIGVEMKTSTARARQMVGEAKKALTTPASEFDGLSSRIKNCFKGEKLNTRQEVCEAFHTGRLMNIPNLGSKSYMEICRWLRLPLLSGEGEQATQKATERRLEEIRNALLKKDSREFQIFRKGFFLGREIESKEGYLSYQDLQEEFLNMESNRR